MIAKSTVLLYYIYSAEKRGPLVNDELFTIIVIALIFYYISNISAIVVFGLSVLFCFRRVRETGLLLRRCIYACFLVALLMLGIFIVFVSFFLLTVLLPAQFSVSEIIYYAGLAATFFFGVYSAIKYRHIIRRT